MNKYTTGSTYNKNLLDTACERVPNFAAFKAEPDEKHVFEKREGYVSYYNIAIALENGSITELDKIILSIVAVFGSCCCTSKIIREMLVLMNIQVSDNMFKSSIKRLHRYQLINFSRFCTSDERTSNFRIITLTINGSKLARSLGVDHRFNAMAVATAPAYSVKARVETAQLVCNYLKNIDVDYFKVRPVIVVNADMDAIVRPSLMISIGGEMLSFEVVRRHDGWKEDLSDKLKRYLYVFKEDSFPTIVINGEDEEMNLEISGLLNAIGFDKEVLYTDDLATFGQMFKYSLYQFNESGDKQCFMILQDECIE